MPIAVTPPEVLREKLGPNGTQALVDLLNQVYEIQQSDLAKDIVAEVDSRDTGLKQVIVDGDTRLEKFITSEVARLETLIADVKAELKTSIAQSEKEIIKWMFLFWTGSVVTILGGLLAFLKLFFRP